MSHDEGQVCLCVADHRPAPLELEHHHVWPLGMGGPDVAANLVWLCSTAHGNVHELLRLILAADRPLSDYELQQPEDRPVSRYAAVLAREGYRRFTERSL
jgi:hypothetical protein